MGWTISHSTPPIMRSYSGIAEFAQHVAHVLPARKWRTVERVLAPRTDGYLEIPPAEAARMAGVFREAARHRLMPREWADLADRLAAAAGLAAGRGESWVWR